VAAIILSLNFQACGFVLVGIKKLENKIEIKIKISLNRIK